MSAHALLGILCIAIALVGVLLNAAERRRCRDCPPGGRRK